MTMLATSYMLFSIMTSLEKYPYKIVQDSKAVFRYYTKGNFYNSTENMCINCLPEFFFYILSNSLS